MGRKSTKLMTLTLLCLTVLFLFASCKSENADAHTQSPITKNLSVGKETPDLFEDGTWYDGRVFYILVAGNSKNNDFDFELEGGNIVDKAKYNTVKAIREKYGVDIQTHDITAPNSSDGAGVGYKILKNDYYSEDKVYDAAMLGGYDAANAACHGYLSNMNSDSFPHLDLSKSWWSQSVNTNLSVEGMIFYTTGDISLSDNKNTYCVVFNKLIEASSSMENPYELMARGEWTWDRFSLEVKKLASAVQYGLGTDACGILAAYASTGCSIAEVNENGELELSAYSPSAVSVLDKYTELLRSGAVFVGDEDVCFEKARCAYAITTLEGAESLVRAGLEIGYLPLPKLAGEGERYRCLVSAYYTQFVCVPYYVGDKTLIGGILEELAYSGKTSVSEAYKQTLLGENYTKDDRASLDTVFTSAFYDIGQCYKIGGISSSIEEMSYTRLNTFADIYSDSKLGASGEIKEINECFNNIIKSLKYG